MGHDVNYIAFAGALGLIGRKGGAPVIPLNLLADYAGGGLSAVIGIETALLVRERTGRGQFVDMSMTDGVVYMLTKYFSEYFAGTWVPERGNNSSGGRASHYYNVYKTKDRKYITIGSVEPWLYANLCRALGHEDFIPYQFATGAKRREMLRVFRQMFLTRTRDEWFDILNKTDTCAGKVQSFDEVIEHPHFLERQMFVELDDPQKGKVKQVGIGIKLSDTPGSIRSLVPKRGEHTNEILTGLGYKEEKIADLRHEGCIG